MQSTTPSPIQNAAEAASSSPLTRLQTEVKRRLTCISVSGSAEEKRLLARLPRTQDIDSLCAWLRESGGGLDFVETLRAEVEVLWQEHRPDDRAIELAAFLFLAGAEARILEKLGTTAASQATLILAASDQTVFAILGLCLLDRGFYLKIDPGQAQAKPQNLVTDFEVHEPGKDVPHGTLRRELAAVEQRMAGRKLDGSMPSVETLEVRLRMLGKSHGIRPAVAVLHGDPKGILSEPGALELLSYLDVSTFFYGADKPNASFDHALLADVEADLPDQLQDILASVRARVVGPEAAHRSGVPFVFFSYSHHEDDQKWNANLIAQLRVPEVHGKIRLWVDEREIDAGQRWNQEIQSAINQADVAVLMVSKHFMTSPYIRQNELPPLRLREKAGLLRFVPVLVGACPWKQDEELSALQFAAGTEPLNKFSSVGDLDDITARIAEKVLSP